MLETIAGRGLSPVLILLYLRGLPDTSLTHALIAGGREFHGWGQDRHLRADTYDALNWQTKVVGQWGKGGPPKVSDYPRPTHIQEAKKKPKTVKELWAALSKVGK